jgi:hypothetical protein
MIQLTAAEKLAGLKALAAYKRAAKAEREKSYAVFLYSARQRSGFRAAKSRAYFKLQDLQYKIYSARNMNIPDGDVIQFFENITLD